MKITIIGYWGAYPEKGEATTGYLLQTDEYNILIDCGSGILASLQEYIDLCDIDAVILSHYHSDHIADVFCYHYNTAIDFYSGKRKKPLEIYAHKRDSQFEKLSYQNFCAAKEINEKTILSFGDLKVSFQWGKHPIPSLAMKFEKDKKIFVYSGDTEYCDGIVEISKNADVFLCECTFYNEQLGKFKGHLTSGEVGDLSEMNKVKKLVLTHFPHYSDLTLLKSQVEDKYNGQVEMASKGKIINI